MTVERNSGLLHEDFNHPGNAILADIRRCASSWNRQSATSQKRGCMLTDSVIFILVILVSTPPCVLACAATIAMVFFGANDDRTFFWQHRGRK